MTSSQANAYLMRISGNDLTAKDFRTWHGTAAAALALQELETFDNQVGAKKHKNIVIQRVAAPPTDTLTIRKCHIHPDFLSTCSEGSLLVEAKAKIEAELPKDLQGLKPETAVLTLLQMRRSGMPEHTLRKSVARAA